MAATAKAIAADAATSAGDSSSGNPQAARLDRLQRIGDVVGVADPTGIVDGVNAVVSLQRATKEPGRRKEHLENALISGISIIPLIGDLAKLAKVRRAGAATKAQGKAARATPATVLPGAMKTAATASTAAAQGVLDGSRGAANAGGMGPLSRGVDWVRNLFAPVTGRTPAGASRAVPPIAAAGRRAAATPPSARSNGQQAARDAEIVQATLATPAGEFASATERESQSPWAIFREWWQSSSNKRADPRWRQPDRPNRRRAPRSNQPAPGDVRPTFGQAVGRALEAPKELWTAAVDRTTSATKGTFNRAEGAVANWLYGGTQQAGGQKRGFDTDSLKRNFGDIMAGKSSASETKRQAEGERNLAEAKKKLREQVEFLAGAMGRTARFVVGLGIAALSSLKILQTVNAATLGSQSELSYVNGTIAMAGNRREVAKFQRDAETARTIAPSHVMLSDSQIRFEKALAPGQNLMTELFNHLMASLTGWVAQVVDRLNSMARKGEEAGEPVVRASGSTLGAMTGVSAAGPAGAVVGALVGEAAARAAIASAKAGRKGTLSPDMEPPWLEWMNESREGSKPKDPRRL